MQDAEVEAPGYDFEFAVTRGKDNNNQPKTVAYSAVVEQWAKGGESCEKGLVYQSWSTSFMDGEGRDLLRIQKLWPFAYLFEWNDSDKPSVMWYLIRCLAKALANTGEVYVARNVDEPDPKRQAIGWVCIDPNQDDGVLVVHYIYIKPEYRKSRAAELLLMSIGIDKNDTDQPIRFTFKPENKSVHVPQHWTYAPSLIGKILQPAAPWYEKNPEPHEGIL